MTLGRQTSKTGNQDTGVTRKPSLVGRLIRGHTSKVKSCKETALEREGSWGQRRVCNNTPSTKVFIMIMYIIGFVHPSEGLTYVEHIVNFAIRIRCRLRVLGNVGRWQEVHVQWLVLYPGWRGQPSCHFFSNPIILWEFPCTLLRLSKLGKSMQINHTANLASEAYH